MAISKIILNGVTQMDLTGDTVEASNLLQSYTAHKNDGTQVTGTATQGITPTGTLNITVNDTYDVTNYASAVVNVSGGGASNIVTGTFKGTTTGAAMDVTLNYSGSGYPIAVVIYPSEGVYNSSGTLYSTIARYACVGYIAVKDEPSTTPSYSSSSADKAWVSERHKSSTSTASTTQTAGSVNTLIFSTSSASGSGGANIVTFPTLKKMSVMIKGSNYGFVANIEYTYHIIYSS